VASQQSQPNRRHSRVPESERLRQENEELRRKLAEKERELAEQQRRIADLQRQLAAAQRNSTNSSKPPSSDGLAGRQRERGRPHPSPRKRKAGGQPGHRGHHRPLVPSHQVSVLEVVLPQQCRHCAARLPSAAEERVTEGEPRRHQVTEIPPVQAHITEYQFPNIVCAVCGQATRAALPEEIAGQFGPHLTALIAYWTVVCRLPRRLVEAMLGDVLGIRISLGSTQKAWEEVSQAVAHPVAELQAQLPGQALLNVDETGWRSNGDKRWMWVLVAPQFVFYVIAAKRSAEVLVTLLGTVFHGILGCDRWVVYLTYHGGRMQLCWAHLKRNILGIADSAHSRSAQRFCRDALAIVARLFRLWYRFRGDLHDRRGNPKPLNRRQLRIKALPLEKQLFALAERHLNDRDREVRNLATALFMHCHRLFTFVEEEGVEPTNNIAERSLRSAVQWRKISFGNRSPEGEIAVARLLTVSQTCKRQQRHILVYLTEAVRCYRRAAIAPPLLPQRS